MWVRGAAIRPVPSYAVVSREHLDRVEQELASDSPDPRSDLVGAFSRFEATQVALSRESERVLVDPLDETALALGHFLTVAVWLGFERAFGARLGAVTDQAFEAARSALDLEEELRASHSEEPLELEDVMAIEQPGVLAFVNEHVEAALEPAEIDGNHPNEGALREVDVDDVHTVYRMILVLTLALSHAVSPVSGTRPREMLA